MIIWWTSLDVNLGKLWETVKDRETWQVAIHRVTESWTRLSNWITSTTICQRNPGISVFLRAGQACTQALSNSESASSPRILDRVFNFIFWERAPKSVYSHLASFIFWPPWSVALKSNPRGALLVPPSLCQLILPASVVTNLFPPLSAPVHSQQGYTGI